METYYINLGGRLYQTKAKSESSALTKAKKYEKALYGKKWTHPRDIIKAVSNVILYPEFPSSRFHSID